MWWNGETILVLLLVAVVHGTMNNATEMDMAPDSVDDRYQGCRKEVLDKVVVKSGLLEKELDASPEFKEAWTLNMRCALEVPGGLPEHSRALLAFANAQKSFRSNFNAAVKTMAQNNSFPFWSLHFLLTDSMMLLKEKECKTVYLVSMQSYSAQKGSSVRLGGFMAVLDASEVEEHPDLDGGVLFNITSCFVLDLEKITCGQENVQMLLGPSEVYTVEDVRMVTKDNYKMITLKHHNFSSTDCHLSPRSDSQRGSSTNVLSCIWVVYLMVAILSLLQ